MFVCFVSQRKMFTATGDGSCAHPRVYDATSAQLLDTRPVHAGVADVQSTYLYSSIFFDMQVPYTCAAVRAFNPYRSSAKELLMSPIYTHIVFDSLNSARKLRDTIPLKVKRLAMKYMAPKHAALSSASNEDEQLRSDHDVEGSGISSSSTHSTAEVLAVMPQPPEERLRRTVTGTYISSTVAVAEKLWGVCLPTIQECLVQSLSSKVTLSWTSSRTPSQQMQNKMNCVHIIAKRADLDKPLDSGIDVVHHVMDTFLV
ncbi:hypothetical protein GQ600_3656 [Phytophthora cactorum]|nr:hypothetical protein GQ600_3656 [Phytophthora cactorum]